MDSQLVPRQQGVAPPQACLSEMISYIFVKGKIRGPGWQQIKNLTIPSGCLNSFVS